MDIICGNCGHSAGFEAFTSTLIGGDLPHDTYQCPACHRAWKRVPAGGWRKIPVANGSIVVPAAIRLESVQALL